MVVVQARRFLTPSGGDPSGCQITTNDDIYVEVVVSGDYPGVNEKLNFFEITIAKPDNTCVKRFRSGVCCVRAGYTYTWVTPRFKLPVGSYNILTGQSGNYDCAGTYYCADGMTIPEVSC